jgi:hypothetical protein
MLSLPLTPPRATRGGRQSALLAFVLALADLSCARRAPGPEECHALAVQWVGREGRRGVSQRFGGIVLEAPDSRILDRTTECLTTPYDRELVACIASRASPALCFGAFQSRRSGLAAAP